MSQTLMAMANTGSSPAAGGGDPSVVLIGMNCSILAASPKGMRFVQEAAGWVAKEVRGSRGQRASFGDAVIQVLEGKCPLVCLENPMARTDTGNGPSHVRIVPAYGREAGDIIGALVIVDE